MCLVNEHAQAEVSAEASDYDIDNEVLRNALHNDVGLNALTQAVRFAAFHFLFRNISFQGRSNSADADSDTLRGEHLADACACGVRSCEPHSPT